MAQYTSTATSSGGTIVNSVLNSETNTITITATTPSGIVATTTINANGDLADAVVALRNQWTAQDPNGTISRIELSSGIRNATISTVNNVKGQSSSATAESIATNTPPPAERQAIPTNSTVDPAIPPATAEPDVEEPSNIDTEIQAEEDPEVAFYQEQQRINESVNDPLTTPPGTDEFDGLDTQLENNQNGLQEPPELSPEETEQALNNIEAPEYTPVTSDEVIARSNVRGLAPKTNAQAQATAQDQAQFTKQEDWRVRLSLAPSATYLYKSRNPGILKPLADTNGVIFPYTPSIQVSYAANYDATDLVHANYKVYQYKNSGVDNIQISCDFTAQDTYEANYLLAVIHFFRSVTKMFYGQDNGPKPGTPPPLCFLTGLGAFQFNEHPLAIVSFTYSLPTDVDYIRAGQITSLAGVNQQSVLRPVNAYDVSQIRLNNIKPGGSPADTVWGSQTPLESTVTYVPTKMQIQISAVPMMSRNDVSNNFSLTDYASGKLLRGLQNVRGGFW